MNRTRTVTPEVGRSLAAVQGRAVSTAEVVSDPTLPDLPSAVLWSDPVPLLVPRRFHAVACPECGGTQVPGHPDPLQLEHEERCDTGAEEAALLTADLRRLTRTTARGRSTFHRVVAPVERDLLDGVDLNPRTAFVGVHAEPFGRRCRTFAGLRDEPALSTIHHHLEETP